MIILVAGWLAAAGLLAVLIWPWTPHTAVGWILLVVFGPPIMALGEWAVAWLGSTRLARAFAEHTNGLVRVLLGAAVGAAFIGLTIWFDMHLGG